MKRLINFLTGRPCLVLLLLLPLWFCMSCGFIKKTGHTVSIKQTLRIDTLVTIRPSLIPVTVRFPVWDTARAENETATAKSYIDTATRRIVLTLTGKTFTVPVQMVKQTSTITKDNIKRPNVWAYVLGILITLLVFYGLWILNKRLPKFL